MKEIAYIAMVVYLYSWWKEIIETIINCRKWKYINWNKLHNVQHVVFMVMSIFVLIAMAYTCTNTQKLPLLFYSLFMHFFLIPHFKAERVNNL